jgi:hypothetical protein
MSTCTPFDKLFTERLLICIHALFHLGKFSLRRVSRLQVAKIKACTKRSVNFEITNALDVFGNLVLLPTVQHLDLVQPPSKFMDALPTILSEVLKVSHVHNKDTNPDVYKLNSPHITSAQMTHFKVCVHIRQNDPVVMDLLALALHL